MRLAGLSGEGEVVHLYAAEHGVVAAVSFEAAALSIFQVFIRAKKCLTRAWACLWAEACYSFQAEGWFGRALCGAG